MGQIFSADKDAFSNGQIGSKLWLCEELEKLFDSIDLVHIYGGWYGLTAFLLFSRNNIKINKIYSFDVDPGCEPVADAINENWVINEWQFKAFTQDCNQKIQGTPDLVINTSTEHFTSLDWWHRIPRGTVVALQGNNMIHDDHFVHSETLDDFVKIFNPSKIMYSGQKEFKYPTWSFTRFMLIGEK